MSQLKKILGTHAYWVINKELANDIGLHATLVLQHFIDLQTNFFEDGGFYQQQHRILEDLPITIDYLRKAVKVLQNKGFITVVKRGVPAKNHYTVNEAHVLIYLSSITSSVSEAPLEVSQKDDKHKELNKTKNKETNIDDAYGKIFFRIVDAYPANRIGNRQHGLKKFKNLTMDEAKLAATNLKRYLAVAGEFVKSLQNYIDQKCFAEDWLKAEEETKRKKLDKTNTKTFNKNYNEFI